MEIPDEHVLIKALDTREIPDDVPDKAWVKIMVELAYGLSAEADKHGWDQPHDLLLIRGQRFDEPELQAVGGALSPTPVPQFHQMVVERFEGRVWEAIVHAAYGWDRTARQLPKASQAAGKEVHAVALLSEGWALIGAESKDVGRIAEHPDRVETRMVDLALRGNTRVSFMQPRDGAPRHTVSQADDPVGYAGSVGDIPNALQFFMQTITLGHVPMEWADFEQLWDYR